MSRRHLLGHPWSARAVARRVAPVMLLVAVVTPTPATAALAGPLAFEGSRANAPAKEAATSGDRVLARSYLPSAERIHGELVLARRGAALVMDTLLYSNSLRRGADRIRKKELYYWPADRRGAEDSARYLKALEYAKRHVLERFDHITPGDAGAARDPRPRLLIEFTHDGTHAQVVFYDVEVEATKSGFAVSARRPIVTVDASPDYVARAMRIQGDEGFDRTLPELAGFPK
jgi:hypothetical protein